MRRAILGVALACSVLAVVSSGCSRGSVTIGKSGPYASHDQGGHGPPAHAPAHGHRRKHHASGGDLELRYDGDLGVYVVIELPDHYYWNGYYLRIQDGGWYASAELEGHWKRRSSASLPPGLRMKYAKPGKPKKHPGKGRGAAKGRW